MIFGIRDLETSFLSFFINCVAILKIVCYSQVNTKQDIYRAVSNFTHLCAIKTGRSRIQFCLMDSALTCIRFICVLKIVLKECL